MGKYRSVQKVKLFIGIITKFVDEINLIKNICEKHFGQIEDVCNPVPFTYTDYYIKEQGAPLYRVFFSFTHLIFPGAIVLIKRWTNYVECKLKEMKEWGVERPFNLDPGYVGLSQMVLASTKPYSHRLYLGSGIYAEVTLIFKNGGFTPMPWTYKDYRTIEYLNFFNKVRDALKKSRIINLKKEIEEL